MHRHLKHTGRERLSLRSKCILLRYETSEPRYQNTIQLNAFTIPKTLLPTTSCPSRQRVTCINLTQQIKVINHRHLILHHTAPRCTTVTLPHYNTTANTTTTITTITTTTPLPLFLPPSQRKHSHVKKKRRNATRYLNDAMPHEEEHQDKT
jgi:hypothetical protein